MNRFKKITVATDLCSKCNAAARFALLKAQQDGKAIEFVHGTYLPGNPDNLPPEADRTESETRILFSEWLESLGVDPTQVESQVVAGPNPSEALISFIGRSDTTEVVMGKTRSGLKGILFGNRVSQALIQKTNIPVTLIS